MWTRMFQQSKKSGLAPHLEELTIKGQQTQNHASNPQEERTHKGPILLSTLLRTFPYYYSYLCVRSFSQKCYLLLRRGFGLPLLSLAREELERKISEYINLPLLCM